MSTTILHSEMDLRALLSQQLQCPTCKHGALKTSKDHERGYCDACYMLKHDGIEIERQKHQAVLARFRKDFPVVASSGSRDVFRSEANAYDHDIYDRD